MPDELHFSDDTSTKGDANTIAPIDFEGFEAVRKGGLMGAFEAIQDMAVGAAAPKMQSGADFYNNNRQIIDNFQILSGQKPLEFTPLPELEPNKKN